MMELNNVWEINVCFNESNQTQINLVLRTFFQLNMKMTVGIEWVEVVLPSWFLGRLSSRRIALKISGQCKLIGEVKSILTERSSLNQQYCFYFVYIFKSGFVDVTNL